MLIGDRIAKRRKEIGMTQDELAKKTGYKSKAAISKIETNVNDITQTTIVKFAEALDTTVGYLMGWEEETPKIAEQHEDDLPEITLIARAGKKMSPDQRELMLRWAKMSFPEAFKDDD